MHKDFILDSIDTTVGELLEQLSEDMELLQGEMELTRESLDIYREEMAKVDDKRNSVMNAIKNVEMEQSELESQIREKESIVDFIMGMIRDEAPMEPVIPNDKPTPPIDEIIDEPTNPIDKQDGDIAATPIEPNEGPEIPDNPIIIPIEPIEPNDTEDKYEPVQPISIVG